MFYLRLLLLTMILIAISCGKDEIKDDPNNEDPQDEVLVPGFEMEIDGIKWEADNFYYEVKDGLHVVFATDLTYSVRWDIEKITTGIPYVLGKQENKLISSFYQYIMNSPVPYVVESGELTIEKFDTTEKIFSGKFNFKASYQGKPVNISNGKFVIKDF